MSSIYPPVTRWAPVYTLVLVGLGGCAADAPPPQEQLAQAEQAVDTAGQSNASEFAALELRTAEDKLEQARQAMQDEDYVKARRLAEAAQVDARLAERKAQSQSTINAAQELSTSIETLRRESERAIETAPPSAPQETQ